MRDVDIDKISLIEIQNMDESLGYVGINKFTYKRPTYVGLRVLKYDNDIVNMISLVPIYRIIDVFHWT